MRLRPAVPAAEETHYWGEIGPNLRAIDIRIGEDPLAGNTRAHRFYQRLGFAPVGPRKFGDDDCLVYQLDRRT